MAVDAAITAAKNQIKNDVKIGSSALRDSFVAIITAQTEDQAPADPSEWLDIDDVLKMA